MKPLKILFLLCATSVFAQVPANDECTNAEAITVSTSLLSLSVDFTEATESLDASCNTETTNNKDLWYEFTMPINGILRISNTGALNYFTLYETCGGAEIACGKDDSSFGNLVNGNNYLLRASFQFNGSTTFSLQALTPAVNDECINRETITLSTTNFAQPSPNTSFASKSVDASCDTSNNIFLDIWYEFVMPVNGNVEITFADNKQSFVLYDSCSGNEIQCFNDDGLFQNLNQNTSYIIRVAERSTDAGLMNFRIQAYEFATNDECVNSETIIVETANTTEYQADLRTATESVDASCETASNSNYDLWFNFTMPITGNLKIDQLTGLDTATIYDSCGGTEISCQSGEQFVSGLIQGVNYIVRIAATGQVNKQPRFQAFPLAINDECANSEFITVDANSFSDYTIDTRTATETLNSICDNESETNLDLWYEFVMPVTGNVQISNVAFTFRATLYNICSGEEIDCFNGNGTFFNLAYNGQYKLRISHKSKDAIVTTFRIQAFENIFNDECTTPQDIIISENEFTTHATNNAAASNSEVTTCEPSGDSFTVQDVWYRFTMPSNNDIEIDHLTTTVSGYYALYDSCGTTELECFVNDGFFNSLIAGNEYLLKVGKLSSQSGELSFKISAKAETLSLEKSSFMDVTLYPNPVKDNLQISLNNQNVIDEVKIYNVSGQLVKTIPNETLQNNLSINMSSLKSMLYFIVISSNEVHVVRRIIKQ